MWFIKVEHFKKMLPSANDCTKTGNNNNNAGAGRLKTVKKSCPNLLSGGTTNTGNRRLKSAATCTNLSAAAANGNNGVGVVSSTAGAIMAMDINGGFNIEVIKVPNK